MSFAFLQKNFDIAPPPLTSLGIGLTLAQGLGALYYIYQVRHPKRDFVDPQQLIEPDVENLVTYGPATAIAYWANETYGESSKVPKLLLAHFGKQLVSVFMKNTVSKPKPGEEEPKLHTLLYVAKSSIYYAVVAYLVGTNAIPGIKDSNWGQIVFAIGQVGQFVHKNIVKDKPEMMAASRSGTSSRSLTKAGLYKYIEHPQQLFSIVTWAGIGLASQQFNAVLQAGAVLLYSLVLASDGEGKRAITGGEKRYKLIPFIY